LLGISFKKAVCPTPGSSKPPIAHAIAVNMEKIKERIPGFYAVA
jgi:hypothetical protein